MSVKKTVILSAVVAISGYNHISWHLGSKTEIDTFVCSDKETLQHTPLLSPDCVLLPQKSIFQLHSITQRTSTSVTLTALTDILLPVVTFGGFTGINKKSTLLYNSLHHSV